MSAREKKVLADGGKWKIKEWGSVEVDDDGDEEN